jgi:hypothetical protein
MCGVLLSTVLNIGVSKCRKFQLVFQNNNLHLIIIIIIIIIIINRRKLEE